MAVQVLPEAGKGLDYSLVDTAIETIQASGHKYQVCPFETVVECSLSEALELIDRIHESCGKAGTRKMITFIKIESDFGGDASMEDKMSKYK